MRGRTHDIVTYYDETWLDYRLLWMTRRNPAIHFGYWSGETRSHAESLDNMNRVMADVAGVGQGDDVLDAGCGVGGGALWLARHRGARVAGITIVPSQVARARQFASASGVDGRVTFTCQDYSRTAFRDASFDVVWALESVCHAADKGAFFHEAHRLLRPGGRLVVSEYARAARPLPPRDEALLREWLAPWAIPDLGTPEELEASARRAGFADVVVRDETGAVEPSLRRLHRLVTALAPGAALLHRVGFRSDVQHGNVHASAAMWRALRRRLWRYAIISARKPPGPSPQPAS